MCVLLSWLLTTVNSPSPRVSALTSHALPEGSVNETVMSQRCPLPPFIPIVWVSVSLSQFAALMNVTWVSCITILFVSYLLCFLQHPKIGLHTLCFSQSSKQAVISTIIFLAPAHNSNMLWPYFDLIFTPLNVTFASLSTSYIFVYTMTMIITPPTTF